MGSIDSVPIHWIPTLFFSDPDPFEKREKQQNLSVLKVIADNYFLSISPNDTPPLPMISPATEREMHGNLLLYYLPIVSILFPLGEIFDLMGFYVIR